MFQKSPPPHVGGYEREVRGEGLIRRPFDSLTKWQSTPTLSPKRGNHLWPRRKNSLIGKPFPALEKVLPPHEPKCRAGCPHPAAGHAGHIGRPRRGEDTQPYPPLAVQGFKARSFISENSLPGGEGRGENSPNQCSRFEPPKPQDSQVVDMEGCDPEVRGEGIHEKLPTGRSFLLTSALSASAREREYRTTSTAFCLPSRPLLSNRGRSETASTGLVV